MTTIIDQDFDTVAEQLSQLSPAQREARRSVAVDELARLENFERLSNTQEQSRTALAMEIAAIDSLRSEADIKRARDVANLMRVAQNPRNCESGDGARMDGTPALIGDRNRVESAAEIVARSGNPWGSQDGPVYRVESAAGLVARANVALEALESTLTPGGCEKLAESMAESYDWPGVTVKRSKDEQAEAAELILALSNPHYASAFRSVLRYPADFMAGGTGYLSWSDDERNAWAAVRQNDSCRAAFAESAGSTGAFALPLQLSPNVILTNAGSSNYFRQLARTVIGTSNVTNFITSAGSTANWLAEAATVTDTTPSIGQLAITAYKESVWIFGSFEAMDDTALDTQVPAFVADAKDRLEAVAFCVGTGSGQPFGVITHGTSDATVGALTAAMVYGLHNALPPRFRTGPGARPYWIANVAIMNALRQLPAFTGAVNPILNDATNDSIPEVLGIDIVEASGMDALNVTSGHKNLCLLDMNSYVIVNRQPEVLLFENLITAPGGNLPTGQRGWFSYSRTGADLTTATAAQFHTT